MSPQFPSTYNDVAKPAADGGELDMVRSVGAAREDEYLSEEFDRK